MTVEIELHETSFSLQNYLNSEESWILSKVKKTERNKVSWHTVNEILNLCLHTDFHWQFFYIEDNPYNSTNYIF